MPWAQMVIWSDNFRVEPIGWRGWRICRLLCMLGLHVSMVNAGVGRLEACRHCSIVFLPKI